MPRKISTGRGGGLREARELICLISALREEGDELDPYAVQKRLGCSAEHVDKLLDILTTASAGDLRIPLAEEGGTYSLAGTGGLHGERLALTDAEKTALQAAKEALEKVDAGTLFACVNALNLGLYLLFGYRKAAGGALEQRCVLPRRIYRDHGNWHLEGHDVARNATRVFRLDRMEGASCSPQPQAGELKREGTRPREVELTFNDPRYLEIFDWPGLVLDATGTVGTIPYFGTEWLVRQLAACGGAVTTSDRGLRELAVAYARRQLNALG